MFLSYKSLSTSSMQQKIVFHCKKKYIQYTHLKKKIVNGILNKIGMKKLCLNRFAIVLCHVDRRHPIYAHNDNCVSIYIYMYMFHTCLKL